MYDSLSRNYDRFVNWQNCLAYEMPFIITQLEAQGKEPAQTSVLDAACGTGMHVIELTQRGYPAFGTDLNKPMILKAIENATAFDIHPCFKAVGFGEISQYAKKGLYSRGFDAVLCLGNSLPHILTQVDLDAALADFTDCLAPGGFLLIQNRNFDSVISNRQRWMEPQSYHSKDGEWVFIRFYDFEPDGSIHFHILTLHRQGSPDWEQKVESTHLFPWTAQALTHALQKAGFTKMDFFGSMTGEPFNIETSGNLIIRAELE